jgi:acetyl-CoA carboxylase beta subunit
MNLEQKLEELKKRDGGKERRERQHKEGKMSARERVEFLLDEGTFEETDKLVTHRCTDFGMEEQKYLRRRLRHRLRPHRRAAGLRLRAGLHRLRRLALGNQRRQDRARSWTWP